MKFTRTTSGLIAKHFFYAQPLVWVEGDSDMPFYQRILRGLTYRLEDAGGKEACKRLAQALVDEEYPYVVVLDGDYDILERTRSVHRRVVLLHRHSMENYLFEKEPVERVCCDYAGGGQSEDLLGDSFEALIEYLGCKLLDLLVLDVAHHRADTGHQVFPAMQSLFESRREMILSCDRIERLCAECRSCIDENSLDEARDLVEGFLENRRFVDLLRGHLVFSILRDLITNVVKQKTGHRPYIDNDGLIILLSAEVWSLIPNRDHESLRRRLRQAVREAQRMRQSSHSR